MSYQNNMLAAMPATAQLGIYHPEWISNPSTTINASANWTLITVHRSLAGGAVQLVDLFEVLDLLRSRRIKQPVLHLRLMDEPLDCMAASIDALLKNAVLEYSDFAMRSVTLDHADAKQVLDVETRILAGTDTAVLWTGNLRRTRTWKLQSSKMPAEPSDWLAQDVILVTGGLGGIGRALTEQMMKQPDCRIALVGRSEINVHTQLWMDHFDGRVHYFQADVSDLHQCERLISDVQKMIGQITVVMHAAGVLHDAWLSNLDNDRFNKVLAPKVQGAIYLDQVLSESKSLRLFILFSSLAAVIGQVGQGAYAAANAWLDHFAVAREKLKNKQQRCGVTRSIAWPLWLSGSMTPPDEVIAELLQLGLQPMPTTIAMDAMSICACASAVIGVPLWGELDRATHALGLTSIDPSDLAVMPSTNESIKNMELSVLTDRIAAVAEKILKLPKGRLDPSRSLSAYGFDSISLTRYASALKDQLNFKGLAPATFLDYPTLNELAAHLMTQLPVLEMKAIVLPVAAVDFSKDTDVSERRIEEPSRVGAFDLLQRAKLFQRVSQPRQTEQTVDSTQPSFTQAESRSQPASKQIAVIGIGCRFAGVEGVVQFWDTLLAGKQMISRVPADRWDWNAIDGVLDAPGNLTDCHFGGFISDVAGFDADLFGLSEQEAQTMDPQHRMVLEAAWAALEDAGIPFEDLRGKKVGAFVGVQRQEYQVRLLTQAMDGTANTGNSHAMLVNRLSYQFGWTGPSLAIDTGCSGSGVAIHQAVRALLSGECTHAIAGGVNIVLSPESVVVNRRMGLLTADKIVRPFDKSADGHLFADGAALVVLKSLEDAQADGDFVYGVLTGTSTNHNGESMFLTAPSPRGQAQAISEALLRAQVGPDDIDFVEAQGAANTFVDSAELEAYRQVFAERGRVMPIGSLKGNFGHLESVSGVASLIKAMMQARQGILLPTLGHSELNWDSSRHAIPCEVVTQARHWPVTGKAVRRASVHNFGYGGTNVHMVIESAVQDIAHRPEDQLLYLPISARTEERLHATLHLLADFLSRAQWRNLAIQEINLADIALTLQSGRSACTARVVFASSSVKEFTQQLSAFLTTGQQTASDVEFPHEIKQWLSGDSINWSLFRPAHAFGRIPLPGTAFFRKRHWIEYSSVQAQAEQVPRSPTAVSAYYDALANSVEQLAGREEMNLLFAPFPKKVAGFSWVKTLFQPELNPEHFQLFLQSQRQMKARLFDRVDLSRVRRVMDIGCGFATDLIALARLNPSLYGRGFTIAAAQAKLAAERVLLENFNERVEVLNSDSATDDMGGPYDLMIGFEVTFHIENKEGLFSNIAQNLDENGDLLLIDCVAQTIGDVSMPDIGQFTPTADQFAAVLARHGLLILHADDASGGVANFLFDPDLDKNLDALARQAPLMAARAAEHRGWTNFGQALEAGLLRYVLLHIRKSALNFTELESRNCNCLKLALPFGGPAVRKPVALTLSSAGTIDDRIAVAVENLLGLKGTSIARDARFASLGVNSLIGLQLVEALNRTLNVNVRMTDLFDYPSIHLLAGHLKTLSPALESSSFQPGKRSKLKIVGQPSVSLDRTEPQESVREQDIAVIGLAARLPGADDIEAFWSNLQAGVDSVGPLSASRLGLVGHATERAGGFLDGIEFFDPLFFGISPREAQAMDPQQRLFLEQCWRAIENAGIKPSDLRGSLCGVIAGVQPSEYGDLASELAFENNAAQFLLGNASSILASRIAYLLDLKGPAISVDTACSSSLVAVHQACRMLRGSEADLMLAGGVSLFLTDKPFRMMSRAGMLSASSRCRSFGADADGITVAEGAGVVVLKRLSDALRDGDKVWGVIRGSAVNQDGATNGITAPSRESQRKLAIAALKDAEVDAASIDYIEAHGTGTPLGDPIEVAALSDAYSTLEIALGQGSIVLGSVKSNIGHASAAAGIAGLIKVLLSLAHEKIPQTLHAEFSNPHIHFEDTPFTLARQAVSWSQGHRRIRRAAVNSLGFAGTNCHMIVQEAGEPSDRSPSGAIGIFPLSARTDAALIVHADRMAKYLMQSAHELDPFAVAATLQDGRQEHEKRLVVMAESLTDVASTLAAFAAGQSSLPGLIIGSVVEGDLQDLIGGQAGELFVEMLMQTQDLGRLARLWCRGFGVDWAGLRAGQRVAPVSLPGYPFERLRCWVDTDPIASSGRVVVAASVAASDAATGVASVHAGLLQPHWVVAKQVLSGQFAGRIAVIGEGIWGGLAERLGASLFAPERAAELVARLGEFEAVVDAGLDASLAERHEVWRAIAGSVLGVRLLVLRGPEEQSAAGAFAGGVAASLAAEYARVWSREMLVVEAPEDASVHASLEPLAHAVACELCQEDGVARVRWNRGVREVLSFVPVQIDAGVQSAARAMLARVGHGPVLITGGLGGLGLALANYLVACGVRVLALTGLRALGAEGTHAQREQVVQALRASGVTVEVYAGELGGVEFEEFVAGVTTRHGNLRGVVHAAGRVGSGARSYVSREYADVWSVASPKADGYAALERVLQGQSPEFVVLYSSISASVPSLAAGLVDYAGANAVLEAQARLAWAQGRREVRAVAWGSWSESGLGAASSQRLSALGLETLSDAQGVALFEQALGVDAPVVLATGLLSDAYVSRLGLLPLSRVPKAAGQSGAMLQWLSELFGRELKLPAGEIDVDRRFEDYGVDSILLADLVVALERGLSARLEPGLLIEHRTMRALAGHLCLTYAPPGGVIGHASGRVTGDVSGDMSGDMSGAVNVPPAVLAQDARALPFTSLSATPKGLESSRIAVIGLACDFPGAPDADTFWRNLEQGVDAVTEVPADRWDIGQIYSPSGGVGRSISKWGGFIKDAKLFDPEYFGIQASDAAGLDPLVRKALEVCVQGLRDAGMQDAELKGSRTGVYLGARMGDYGARLVNRDKSGITGSAQNFIAAQIAHCLDLHGPNLVVDTACSSSLMAVHLAARSLLDGESDLALAGGVDLLLDETPYIGLSAGQALSPRGRCATFDEQADGLVPGEGAGVVVLKRLDRALADGDRILAVLEGSAVNNDGRTMGLTTPNPQAQQAVISEALARAAVSAQTVSYVEAHGTGTMIGDPIELRSLWRALGDEGARGRCGVGSVKSNIGHLLSAAGVASLIKVVLMVSERKLVPTLHCDRPNPRFAFETSPLMPVRALQSWSGVDGVCRAGVSAFGFGGTNVHAVVSNEGIPANYQPTKQALPAQVFNRREFWLEKQVPITRHFSMTGSVDSKLCGFELLEEPTEHGRLFTTVLRHDHPVLRDHVIEGVGIAPGTMYFDLLRRVLHAVVPARSNGFVLRNIVFRGPANALVDRTIRIACALRDDDALTIDVSSVGHGRLTLEPHLAAVALWQETDLGSMIDVTQLKHAALTSFDLEDAYALARKVGIVHGDFMKPRGTVWEGHDFMLAEMSFFGEAVEAASQFILHPSMLDACCLIPFLFERNNVQSNVRPFIPISIGSFEARGQIGTEGWVLVRRTGLGGNMPDDVYHADISLYDAEGNPVARMQRLAAKRVRTPLAARPDAVSVRVPSMTARILPDVTLAMPARVVDAAAVSAISAPLTGDVERDLLDWLCIQIGSILNQAIGQDDIEAGFYDLGLDSRQLLEFVRVLERGLGSELYPTLLFEQGTISRLAAYLILEHAQGVHVLLDRECNAREIVIHESSTSAQDPVQTYCADTLLVVPVFEPQTIDSSTIQTGALFVEVNRISDLQSIAQAWTGTLAEDISQASLFLFGWRGAADALRLIDLCARIPGEAVLVVVHPQGVRAHAEQCAVSGLLASVAQERPRLRLVSLTGANNAEILNEITHARLGLTTLRYLNGERTNRVFKQIDAPQSSWRASGSWVISGGLGGLGLIFARALAADGVKVGVVGRREPSALVADQLKEQGIDWVVCDVCDYGALAQGLDVLRERMGPFTGVIHAAGVLRDGLVLAGIDAESVQAVLAPKMTGAGNLDALTRNDPLDAFVLFSSLSGSFGNVGQTAYSYANGLLDGFARDRTGPGRTLSVAWPLWAEGGMQVPESVILSLKNRWGLTPMPSSTGLQAMSTILGALPTHPHVLVMHGDMHRLFEGMKVLRAESVRATSDRGPKESSPTTNDGILDFKVPHSVHTGGEDEPIAVIGLAGRYPEANDLEQFWQNLIAGVDSVSEVPGSRWDHSAYFDQSGDKAATSWSRWGGFIDGVDQFDPLFFHISPVEARAMDPQERLFIETSFSALEDAGLSREAVAGKRVAVYAGVMWSQYQLFGVAAAQNGSSVLPMSFSGSVANRVSYLLDLRGPSLSLDTACSSSLTALHLAVESLRHGTSDLALAGGVNLTLHPSKYQFLSQGRMLSRDGRCRAFGEGGDGYVPGEGVGVAVLKRLSQAQADGDPIWGVILASGISHGGHTAGYTVPSATRQSELISEVLVRAGVSPQQVSYVEAHGTGTTLGDPIEVSGLKGAFGATAAEPWCALGSVKSNIGHLESAAGIAGLSKVLLQMRHGLLAPTLHAEQINTALGIDGTPFSVQCSAAQWDAKGGVRIAGLSSFGAGGANAHLVIAQAPDRPVISIENIRPEIIVLSARTPNALLQRARDLLKWIEDKSNFSGKSIDILHETSRIKSILIAISAQVLALDASAIDTHEDWVELGLVADRQQALRDILQSELSVSVTHNDFAIHRNIEALAQDFALKIANTRQVLTPDFCSTSAIDLSSLAHTLQVGRSALGQRLAFVAVDIQAVRVGLSSFIAGNVPVLEGPQNLRECAELFLSGRNVAWSEMRTLPHPLRLGSLPTYPFEHKRYWVDAWLDSSPQDIQSTRAVNPLVMTPQRDDRQALRKVWKIDGSEPALGQLMQASSISVLAGVNADHLALGLSDSVLPCFTDWNDGVAKAIDLLSLTISPITIVDLSDISEEPSVVDALDLGRIGFFQTLIKRRPQSLRILHLTRYMNASPVLGLTLKGSVMAGLLKVLGAENPGLFSRTVDVDFDLYAVHEWKSAILRELSRMDSPEVEIRLRGNSRYVPTMEAGSLPAQPDLKSYVQSGQAYLVTGGTRGIGLAIAQSLVDAGADHLALMGKEALPPVSDWPLVLADPSAAPALKAKLAPLQALVSRGVRISLYCGSLTHLESIGQFVASVTRVSGAIAGLVHAAGQIRGDRPLFTEKTSDDFLHSAEPKITGLNCLLSVMNQEALRFVILCSSVASSAPVMGVGMSDYAMGNAYLDALANYQSAKAAKTLWLAVQWVGWTDTGMHTRLTGLQSESVNQGLSVKGLLMSDTVTGISLLAGLMAQGISGAAMPALVLSKRLALALPGYCQLPARAKQINQQINQQTNQLPEFSALTDDELDQLIAKFEGKDSPHDHASVNTQAPSQPSNDNTIASICLVVSQVLELEPDEFGPDMTFQNVGIDSISAVRVVQQLELHAGLAVLPAMLIQYPTPRALSAVLAKELSESRV